MQERKDVFMIGILEKLRKVHIFLLMAAFIAMTAIVGNHSQAKEITDTSETQQLTFSQKAEKIQKTVNSVDKEAKTAIKQKEDILNAAITDVQVTWYADYGETYCGHITKNEQTMAVDPNVIPLGSHIVVKLPDGRTYKGIADDTGSAVKGKIVDIYTDAGKTEANERGRTYGATVYIIKGP